MPPAEVVRLEPLDREAVREEPARERRPREHPDSARLREREHVALGRAREQAVLMLQRDDRADGERALHELRRMVREAAVANLALGDEAHHLAPRLLDRYGRIGIVRLEQVDVIGAQPAQTGLEVAADRLRA